jgi:predicted DNA-binding transcriptional regulator YafY
VRARVWHPSQRVRDEAGGHITLSMDVCRDWALRSWVLSWGPFARVMSPAVLASEVRADLDSAAERYRALSAASRS